MFTKIVGLLASLPIALLCIFSPQVMTIWVGAEYAKLAPLVWCLIPLQKAFYEDFMVDRILFYTLHCNLCKQR